MKINFIYLRSDIANNNVEIDEYRKQYLSNILKNKEISLSYEGTNIFFIESGGSEEKFKKIYQNFTEPYYLLATDANNSLPAALEILSFLNKNNLIGNIIHASKEDIANELLKINKIQKYDLYSLKDNTLLINERLGVIGKPSDWLISSDVNYLDAKKKFGVTLIDISFNEFKEEIDKAITPSFALDFVNKYESTKITRNTIVGALHIYSALKNIITKYNLNGLTVRCFDLLSTVKNTSCLALSLLNKEGYTMTCEGDIPSLISMHLIHKIYNVSSFQANPSYLNFKKNYLYLAHCTLPLDMAQKIELDTHFESNLGVGIKGTLKCEDVTIFKINSSLDKFMCLSGKIDSNLSKSNLCRSQIKVVTNEELNILVNNPCGNHLIVFYGKYKNDLTKILG